MRIRDVKIEDVAAGKNWLLTDDSGSTMLEWGIEASSVFSESDNVLYSALAAFDTGEVRPLLLLREVGTYDWWGDTLEYVDGAWRELARSDEWNAEVFVAEPLENDPSFTGEYSHDDQRAGFARWRDRLRAG